MNASPANIDNIRALIRGTASVVSPEAGGTTQGSTLAVGNHSESGSDETGYGHAEQFCCAVLPRSGYLCIQPRNGSHGLGRPEWASTPQDIARRVIELDVARQTDVYLAIASYKSKASRKAAEVELKRSLYVDLDTGTGKAFSSQSAALQALKQFCEDSQIPFPAILVNSGTGWHAHWPLSQDVSADQWRVAAAHLKAACVRFAFPADSSVTTDVTRLLRVPGTRNHKSQSQPRFVKLARCAEPHDFLSLSTALASAANPTSTLSSFVDSNDLSASMPSPTVWFDDLTSEDQVAELRKMVQVLPDSDADDRGEWVRTLAEIASARSVPWKERVDIAWEFSQRSQKSSNETRSSIDDRMKGLGDQTCVTALRNRSANVGYRPPGGVYPNIPSAVADLVIRYAYVADSDTYFNIERRQLLVKSAVKELETWRMPRQDSGGKPDPVHLLRSAASTQRCEGVAFHPGEGPIFVEDGKRVVNLFRPVVCTELKPTLSERRLLGRFLRHLFPRKSDQAWLKHLLDTLAFLVQHPGQRTTFTMILVGAVEGSGKSTLMEAIPRLLFGQHNVSTVSTHELESNFTDWLARAWIVVFSEISLGRSKEATRIANALKDNQTNPYLRIVEKGRPGRTQRNHVTFFATSNDETHALHLSAFDRRAGVCATSAPRMPTHLATSLHSFLQSPRGAAVLRYLAMKRNLSDFSPHAAPPVTVAKRHMIEASRDSIHAEIVESFERRESPFDRELVTASDVRGCLIGRGVTVNNLSDRRVGQYLRAEPINAQPLEHQIRVPNNSSGTRARFWVLRNAGFWRAATAQSINEHLRTGALPFNMTHPTYSAATPDKTDNVQQLGPFRNGAPTLAKFDQMRERFESNQSAVCPAVTSESTTPPKPSAAK